MHSELVCMKKRSSRYCMCRWLWSWQEDQAVEFQCDLKSNKCSSRCWMYHSLWSCPWKHLPDLENEMKCTNRRSSRWWMLRLVSSWQVNQLLDFEVDMVCTKTRSSSCWRKCWWRRTWKRVARQCTGNGEVRRMDHGMCSLHTTVGFAD